MWALKSPFLTQGGPRGTWRTTYWERLDKGYTRRNTKYKNTEYIFKINTHSSTKTMKYTIGTPQQIGNYKFMICTQKYNSKLVQWQSLLFIRNMPTNNIWPISCVFSVHYGTFMIETAELDFYLCDQSPGNAAGTALHILL